MVSRPGAARPGTLSAGLVLLLVLALSLASAAAQTADNPDLLDLQDAMSTGTRLVLYALAFLGLALVSIVVPDAPLLAYVFSMSIVQFTGARLGLALMQCAIVVLRTGTARHLVPSWPLSAFLLCLAASGAWALDPRESLAGELTGICAMLLQLPITVAAVALLSSRLTTVPRLLSTLVLGCLPGCVLTIKNALAGVRYLAEQNSQEQNQYYMGFIQPDIFSTILLMGAIFLLFCLASSELKPVQRVLAGVLLPLVCVALLLTGIRSGSVALVLILIVLVVRMRNALTLGCIVGLVALVAGLSIASPFGLKLNEKVSSRWSENSFSTGETRVEYWEIAAQGFARRPILGIGWGCFPGFAADHSVGTRAATHNIFVRVACELGVIGLGLFVGWLVATWSKLGTGSIAGLMKLLILGVLVQGLFLDHFICSHFWLFLGLCDGVRPHRAVALGRQELWHSLPGTGLAPAK